MPFIDVSHALYSGMPGVPSLPPVEIAPLTSLAEGKPLAVSKLTCASHSGTHIDAPAHAVQGAETIDEVAVERFIGPGVVTSVSGGSGHEISVDELLAGGPAPERGDMLLIHTGWGKKFDEDSYHDHPSLHPDVGDWAVDVGLNLVGMDTLTPDLPVASRGPDFAFPLHRILLGNGILIAENLRGLGAASGRRVTVHGLPVSVRGGDAGLARIVLELP